MSIPASEPGSSEYERLLSAALRELLPQGNELDLGRIAAAAGVAPDAARGYFASGEALYLACVEGALRRLHDHVIRESAGVTPDDPLGVIERMCHAYCDWALQNTGDFLLMALHRDTNPRAAEIVGGYNSQIHDHAVRVLSRAQDEGKLPAGLDPQELALTLRAYTYGLASLAVSGRMPQWAPEDAAGAPVEAQLRATITRFFRSHLRCCPDRRCC